MVDKVINQNSKALEREQKVPVKVSVRPEIEKGESHTEPRFPPAFILYTRWRKKSVNTLIVV